MATYSPVRPLEDQWADIPASESYSRIVAIGAPVWISDDPVPDAGTAILLHDGASYPVRPGRALKCLQAGRGAQLRRMDHSPDDATEIAEAAQSAALQVLTKQARRDFGKWQLVDYLHDDDLAAVLAGDVTSQNETRVTASIQRMHDEFMSWWEAGNYRSARLIYPAGRLAINDELFSETFAQSLWDMTGPMHGGNRCVMEFDGTIFQLKNWPGRAAVRTSGYFAANGITYAVPKAVFRWMQSTGFAIYPKITGDVSIRGQSSVSTDPVGQWVKNTSRPRGRSLDISSLFNTNVILDNVVNGDFDNLDGFWGGYQPTEFGGNTGHIPNSARFSNTGSIVTCTEPIFTDDHEGKYFGIARASFFDGEMRMTHWSIIEEVINTTQISLADVPPINVSEAFGSFEAIRASTFGTTWTMSAAISGTLVGRPVSLMGARPVGSQESIGILNTVIVAHSGNQIQVAHAPAFDVIDELLVFSPLMLIGGYEGQANDRTDNVGFTNLRLESTAWWQNACIPLVVSNASTMWFENAKLHGAGASANNFGGSACTMALGHVNGLTYDGAFSQANNSPRWGELLVRGGIVRTEVRGKDTVYPEHNRSAKVHLAPVLPPDQSRIAVYWGMTSTTSRYPSPEQVALRLGPNGQENMVVAFGSERRSWQDGASLFPTRFGRILADTMETQYSKQYKATVSAGSDSWKLPLSNNTSWVVTGTAVVREGGGSARRGFTFSAMIGRGAGASSTSINGTPVVTTVAAASAPSHNIALTADTALGALSLDLTGNGTWMVDLTITEARL
ncbi:hypothetical protein SAMN04244548_03011 [Paracoccus pantotrophus]|nr:hypothetical protein SAMN04244548_03011 [Paracoccus pantotrophus]